MDWSYLALLGTVFLLGALVLFLALKASRRSSTPPLTGQPELDAIQPRYIRLDDALRPPKRSAAAIARPTDLDNDLSLPASLADSSFAATGAYAVVATPVVAVLETGPESLRELFGILEHSRQSPLVLVAPTFSEAVLLDLLANQRQQKLQVLPVCCTEPAIVADVCDADIITRADLYAGYVGRLGTVERWVAEPQGSWVKVSTLTS